MLSVTQRIKEVKQPRGGFINPSKFEITKLSSKIELEPEENVHASVIGLVIDYMTRGILTNDWKGAFSISFIGAHNANEVDNAEKLLSKITGNNTESIIAASKLVRYDVCYRAGMAFFKPVDLVTPDKNTINNISEMIKRSISFFDKYGPVVKEGFTLEGGYTSVVGAGDGDFLTKDTLWDFKVTKSKINSKHTLQAVMYYLMGRKSVHNEFDNISKIGFFNPRKNEVSLLEISKIDPLVLEIISKEIIGYK